MRYFIILHTTEAFLLLFEVMKKRFLIVFMKQKKNQREQVSKSYGSIKEFNEIQFSTELNNW